ncbi:hypothetical protein EDB86DRAFT_2824311 [Lactarius hatsudake]|nr:hypothetical protein EDB86DRAFT_2824311 [Lactarius hatsudake]
MAKGITSEGRTRQGGDAVGTLYVLGNIADELDKLEGGGLVAVVEVNKWRGNEFRNMMKPSWMYWNKHVQVILAVEVIHQACTCLQLGSTRVVQKLYCTLVQYSKRATAASVLTPYSRQLGSTKHMGTFAARKDDSLRSIDDAMARPHVTHPVQGDDARGRPAFQTHQCPNQLGHFPPVNGLIPPKRHSFRDDQLKLLDLSLAPPQHVHRLLTGLTMHVAAVLRRRRLESTCNYAYRRIATAGALTGRALRSSQERHVGSYPAVPSTAITPARVRHIQPHRGMQLARHQRRSTPGDAYNDAPLHRLVAPVSRCCS